MPVIPVWSPNGLGAGTDNSIIPGAGGGGVAYPQPPADNTGDFILADPLQINPTPNHPIPENQGQFGSLNFSTNYNALGIAFTMINPGRSANQ